MMCFGLYSSPKFDITNSAEFFDDLINFIDPTYVFEGIHV